VEVSATKEKQRQRRACCTTFRAQCLLEKAVRVEA
jgi:hypothetical protein